MGPPTYLEPSHERLLGRSWPIAELLKQVELVADNVHCVTLVGETGSGKELVAEAIHEASGRDGRLVAINCGALAEGVLESELFGHVQGAFTGATTAREGLVAQAADGTLFLDEVTSTPPRLQTMLLRLLENSTYRAVGHNRELTARVRVVAAAQPDIETATEDGRFRADLWYRLSRRLVDVPTLEQRREDIPLLALHFAQQMIPNARLSMELSLGLVRASWPGNVRQLRNVAERIAEASEDGLLQDTRPLPRADDRQAPRANERIRLRRQKRERPGRGELERVLNDVGGRVAAAAQHLDVDRKTIYRWIEALGIELDALRPVDPADE
jgi:DNA-binding NtrC family response regulator